MGHDIWYTLRTLRRFRGYTVSAGLTLAVGIGGTTAVFSVIDATLLRALPYAHPDRLVALRTDVASTPGASQLFPPSQIELVTWRSSTRFDGVEAAELRTLALTGTGEPEVLDTSAITSGLFPLLGVAPAIGPALRCRGTPECPGRRPVACDLAAPVRCKSACSATRSPSAAARTRSSA